MPESDAPIDEGRRRQFERQWLRHGAATIEDFLPAPDDPTYAATLAELICIDMEMRCRGGNPPSVNEYASRFALSDDTRARLERERVFLARRHVAAGRAVGRYVLRALLGQGAFAEVWQAWDPDLERDVALKLLRPALVDSEDARTRFRREAQSAAQLRHPGIVTVHEVGTAPGGPYLVSDLIPGPTLARAARGKRFTADEAAALVARVAEALDYAHQCGVVHRDIKPGNILLDEAGRPLLADFGLARLESADSDLTQHGDILGTPAYMSPEQARGDVASTNERSDVYSLGVVLYELLCGRPPFTGENPAALAYAIAHDDPKPPRRYDPSVPLDLETVCLKAIAREPAHRYATAAAFAEDLRRFLKREPVAARRRGPLARAALWSRRNPAFAASIVALVVVGAVGLTRVLEERARFRAQREEAQDNLYLALVRETEAQLLVPYGAGREAALESLRTAISIRTGARDVRELRNLALRCLTAPGPWFSRRAAWSAPELPVSLALLPDGARIVETGPAGTFLRDAETGRALAHDPKPARAVAAAPDGGRIAVAGAGALRLLDAATLSPLAAGDAGDVVTIAFGPVIAVGGPDGVELRNATTLERERSLEHEAFSLAFDPTGAQLVCGGDGALRVYDVATGRLESEHTYRDPIRTVAVADDGRVAMAMHEDYSFHVMYPARGRDFEPRLRHEAPVRTALFGPRGYVVSASDDGSLATWDVRLERVGLARTRRIRSAAAGGQRIVTVHDDGGRTLWDVASSPGRMSWFSEHACVFVPGTHRVFAGSLDFNLTDRGVDEQRGAPSPHGIFTWGVAASADGRRLASVAHDGSIKVREARTLALEREMRASDEIAWTVAFSPDGRLLATGDGADVVLWDVATGRERGRLRGHDQLVVALAFHPDGRTLATSANDGTLRLWDWETGAEEARLLERVVVRGLAWRGSALLAACGDGRLRVWEGDGRTPRVVDVSDDPVWAVAVSPSGLVATGSQAGRIHLWDARTWKSLAYLDGVRRVRALDFDDSGRFLAAATWVSKGAVFDLFWLRRELDQLGLDWE